MAAPAAVITIVKRFLYRGNPNEEWSNTYAFTGATPADSTAWRALFDALVAEEKKLYFSNVVVAKGYGYDSVPAPGDSAVWTLDLTVPPNTTVPGTYAGTSGAIQSGDTAMWVRWGLDRLNSKGKRIYLRKYYHPAWAQGTGGDATATSWITAATAFGNKMRDGTFLSSRVITDKLGTATLGTAVSPYVTTRTLKRRGKRP